MRTHIEEVLRLPQFHSAAQNSEYVCDLEYLFSRMNVGSYGRTEPHMWLVGTIHLCTSEDCRSTSEKKRRTHTYDDLGDLLIELALEKENDSHMGKLLRKHLGKGARPTLDHGEPRGFKAPPTPTRVDVKGGVIYVP